MCLFHPENVSRKDRHARMRHITAEALLSRWRRLPPVDPAAFREDVDRLLDTGL